MTPADLDDLLDRELKGLPPPTAPRTLLPRVMAAVEEQAALPWYRRAWLTWPAPLQVLSVLALAAIVVAIAFVLPGAQRATGEMASLLDVRASARTIAMLRILRDATTLMRVSWEVLLAPVAAYVAVFALAVSLGCAALWTALSRLALGGASHQ